MLIKINNTKRNKIYLWFIKNIFGEYKANIQSYHCEICGGRAKEVVALDRITYLCNKCSPLYKE